MVNNYAYLIIFLCICRCIGMRSEEKETFQQPGFGHCCCQSKCKLKKIGRINILKTDLTLSLTVEMFFCDFSKVKAELSAKKHFQKLKGK